MLSIAAVTSTPEHLAAKFDAEESEACEASEAPGDSSGSQDRAEVIFRKAMHMVEAKFGRSEMVFPKDIMWLAGAPGAGKGTLTPHIMELRALTLAPIEVSSLLTSPELVAKKERGELVSDEDVLASLLEALIERTKTDRFGVIVDGFPRTQVQAHCISLLFDEIRALRREFYDLQGDERFRRPIFHITVLFLGKAEAIRRQMHRGRVSLEENRKVELSGVGRAQPVRTTDLDEELAGLRYDHFHSTLLESLQVVKHRFHFHFIDADAALDEVKRRVVDELEYQSSLELGEETFEAVRRFPLATELTGHARQELVRRLDHNYRAHRAVFDRVLDVILDEFEVIMRRQALTGRATIRSVNPIFADPRAAGIALDVLTERGFHASLDYLRQSVPRLLSRQPATHEPLELGLRVRSGTPVGQCLAENSDGAPAATGLAAHHEFFDPAELSASTEETHTRWAIHADQHKVLIFDIQWEPPKIRRGTASK